MDHMDLLKTLISHLVYEPCLDSFHTGVSGEFTSHPFMQIRLVTFTLIHTH